MSDIELTELEQIELDLRSQEDYVNVHNRFGEDKF